MRAGQVVVVGAVGAGVGMVLEGETPLTTHNSIIDFFIGVGVAALGEYVLKMDYVSDFVTGLGVGYAFRAAV